MAIYRDELGAPGPRPRAPGAPGRAGAQRRAPRGCASAISSCAAAAPTVRGRPTTCWRWPRRPTIRRSRSRCRSRPARRCSRRDQRRRGAAPRREPLLDEAAAAGRHRAGGRRRWRRRSSDPDGAGARSWPSELAALTGDAPAETVRALRFRLAHHLRGRGALRRGAGRADAAAVGGRSAGARVELGAGAPLGRGDPRGRGPVRRDATRRRRARLGRTRPTCCSRTARRWRAPAIRTAPRPPSGGRWPRAHPRPTRADAALALLRIAAAARAAEPERAARGAGGAGDGVRRRRRRSPRPPRARRRCCASPPGAPTRRGIWARDRRPTPRPSRAPTPPCCAGVGGRRARRRRRRSPRRCCEMGAAAGRQRRRGGDRGRADPRRAAARARVGARAPGGGRAAEALHRRVWRAAHAPALAPALADLPVAPRRGLAGRPSRSAPRARPRASAARSALALDLEAALDAERRGALGAALADYGRVIAARPSASRPGTASGAWRAPAATWSARRGRWRAWARWCDVRRAPRALLRGGGAPVRAGGPQGRRA